MRSAQPRYARWCAIGSALSRRRSRVPVFTSSFGLTNQTDSSGRHRAGDFAYIATYPGAALGCGAGELGILEGETVGTAAGTWGTRVAILKHC
jgi:hypothetical protein